MTNIEVLDEVLRIIDDIRAEPYWDDFAEPEFWDGFDAGQRNMRHSIHKAIENLRNA